MAETAKTRVYASDNQCSRCRGLMIEDKLYGGEGLGIESVMAFRCVICGEVVDPTIEKNRLARLQIADVRQRRCPRAPLFTVK